MRRRALVALALAHGGGAACVLATFAGALVAGVALHANTPAVRRVARDVGNRVTASLFEGTLAIGEVRSLSIGPRAKVRVREAEVLDPDGRRVILANDVEATIDLERLLGSLAKGGPPDVELEEVRVAKSEVVLDVDDAGAPRIARTFHRRASSADTPEPPEPTPRDRAPRVHIARARLGESQVHGALVPPSLDGDVAGLEASFLFEEKRMKVTVDRGRVNLRSPKLPNQRAPLVGNARGELRLDVETAELGGHVALDGSCGRVPVVARAELVGDRLEATVDVAESDPAAVATAFSDVPLTRPVAIHAHAQGKLPTIALDARVLVAGAPIVATGEIDLREGHAFKLDVDASHVDADAFGAGTATDLSAKITGEGTLSGATGALGTFRVTTTEGTVGSERIPATTIEGRFEGERITAVVRAREPGVEANGKVTFDRPTNLVTFDLQARSSSLRALQRAPNVVGGAASARVQGTIDLGRYTIQATTNGSADGVAVDAFSAGHLSANGVLSGPLVAPVLTVGFAGVDLHVKAGDKAPLVYPTATGHARVALVPTPRILDASVSLGASGADGITVTADAVHVTNGVVETRGLRVTGLGEPLALDARIGGGKWSVRAKSAAIDLHRAAAITGVRELELVPEGTTASVDVDVRQGDEGAEGHLDVVVRSGPLGDTLPAGSSLLAEAHAKIDRGKLVGSGKIVAEGLGQIELTRAELDVPGRLDGRSLKRATGVVEVRGTVDLSQGAALFAGEGVERVDGLASFEARAERGDPAALPAVRATVRTHGLGVALSREEPSRTVTIAGVDLVTHVAWDGRTDDAEVAVLSWDEHGLLGSASAKTRVPLATWMSGAAKIDAHALALLDVNAVAAVPTREVSDLPSFIEAPPLRGGVEGRVGLSGTLGHPKVTVSGRAHGLREDRPRLPGEVAFDPLDGTLEARWDGERAAITFALDERPRRPRRRPTSRGGARAPFVPSTTSRKDPGHLRGLVLMTDLRVSDLLHGKSPAELPWRASAEVEVENLALGALPLTTDVTGSLTGRARVKDLNHEPSFEAKAHVDGFGAGGAVVDKLDVTAGGRDASLFAHASITDESSKATFQLASKSLRMKGVDVSWEPTAPTRLDYAVQNGRLALLAPLVKGAVSEIDGRVDGAGSVTIDPTSQVFEGGLALQDARLYVNAIGEELSALTAIAKFDRTGVFRIDNATGKLGAGEFRASASGRMNGLSFVGGDATVIATKDVPISSEGATFAAATGEVKVSAKMSDDRSALLVTVDVPRANVALPDRSTQSLQPLDPDPTVAIGVRKRNGQLDTAAVRRHRGGTGRQAAAARTNGPGLVTRMSVTLGDSVELEGRGLAVKLGGRTLVEIAEEVRVTGRIDLRGGTIEVHGRRFTVDRGTVTFPEGGDAGNPTIVAAAYWDSPDRTRVWVEFTGPLKTGNLTLRSEPPYSKNEILSVLLFGRPDPNMAAAGETAETAGNTSGATAVGSGFIASDLNRVLSEIDESLDVETDTLSGNRTRAKIGRSFFDRRLKVQVGYAPGRTTYREPDTAYLFLNWQFVPKWSLVATRGDRGTSILDVLFQHRY
ncbi:MAG: translocation/assembly module TamB domain-containing protein [Labilithrix sp.]|nr:translocation/assembly module TamB domain-containing protein [Labilithrix sp.]